MYLDLVQPIHSSPKLDFFKTANRHFHLTLSNVFSVSSESTNAVHLYRVECSITVHNSIYSPTHIVLSRNQTDQNQLIEAVNFLVCAGITIDINLKSTGSNEIVWHEVQSVMFFIFFMYQEYYSSLHGVQEDSILPEICQHWHKKGYCKILQGLLLGLVICQRVATYLPSAPPLQWMRGLELFLIFFQDWGQRYVYLQCK